MDNQTRNYLACVCSYFHLKKKIKVRHHILKQMASHKDDYSNNTELLISFGHPKSLAYSLGYRPLITHQIQRAFIQRFTYTFFIITDILLLLCSIYYLQAFHYIPTLSIFRHLSFLNTLFQHPFLSLCGITLFLVILLITSDTLYKDNTQEDLTWNKEKLDSLPSYKVYSHHRYETYYMIVFVLYFSFSTIMYLLNSFHFNIQTYAKIDMMFYFLQPYLAMILLTYILDLTKRLYTKKYLIISTLSQLFVFIPLVIVSIESPGLKDFMFPIDIRQANLITNTFIIVAILLMLSISLFKIIKNIYYFKHLFHLKSTS